LALTALFNSRVGWPATSRRPCHPADARRQCLYVLSSFQRTEPARPPHRGNQSSVRELPTVSPPPTRVNHFFDQSHFPATDRQHQRHTGRLGVAGPAGPGSRYRSTAPGTLETQIAPVTAGSHIRRARRVSARRLPTIGAGNPPVNPVATPPRQRRSASSAGTAYPTDPRAGVKARRALRLFGAQHSRPRRRSHAQSPKRASCLPPRAGNALALRRTQRSSCTRAPFTRTPPALICRAPRCSTARSRGPPRPASGSRCHRRPPPPRPRGVRLLKNRLGMVGHADLSATRTPCRVRMASSARAAAPRRGSP